MIPTVLTDEENTLLGSWLSIEEVFQTIKNMDGDSGTGPNGFTCKFFVAAWDVIGCEVYKAILSFFAVAALPRSITAISVILLATIQFPQQLFEFRSISLCNFINKVFSKKISR